MAGPISFNLKESWEAAPGRTGLAHCGLNCTLLLSLALRSKSMTAWFDKLCGIKQIPKKSLKRCISICPRKWRSIKVSYLSIISNLFIRDVWFISFSDTKVAQFPELFSPGSDRSKKKKGINKNKSAFQPLKNPCLALNELKSGLEYKLLEQSGPVHMPKFKIAIELDGQTFTGEGR